MSAIEDMLLKFTSGNDVAVQRAVVTLDEWRATYAEYMALQSRVAELEKERDGLRRRVDDAETELTGQRHKFDVLMSLSAPTEQDAEKLLAGIKAEAVREAVEWLNFNYQHLSSPVCGLLTYYANQIEGGA